MAGRATGQSSAIPAWRVRIEERIAKDRALIGRLICFRSCNTRSRIVRTVRMAFAGINFSLSQPDIMQKLTECIDDLKQRIAAWGQRIRRYTERSTHHNQNRLFQSEEFWHGLTGCITTGLRGSWCVTLCSLDSFKGSLETEVRSQALHYWGHSFGS
ncbi:unnamed protein product [Parnassius apollo]|uniref:(apollo) hypothetical protein n=1 Tax=Parnassius apollo TaxID=110799 RepID=A0A8S3XZR8_PARAO|nr:unnamed protein product [Parnassius apollo]